MSKRKTHVIESVEQLQTSCSLPATFLRVIEVIDDENSDRFALARTVETDPTVAEAVLKAANSPLYLTLNDHIDAASPSVTNLPVAVLKIGFGGVRNIALTQGICALVAGGNSLSIDLVTHLLVVAEIARVLGRRFSRGMAEEAYFVGLVHDFGKLVLLRTLPEEYQRIAAHCREQNVSALEAEEELLAPVQPLLRDHIQAGSAILRAHGLPASLVEAVKHHHDNPRLHIQGPNTWDLTGVVIGANQLAYQIGYADGLHKPRPERMSDLRLVNLLSRDALALNELARAAVDRAHEALAMARLAMTPRELRQIGEWGDGNRTGSPSPGPHLTTPIYAACMTVIDLLTRRARVAACDIRTGAGLTPEALGALLERLVGEGYLEVAPGGGCSPAYRATGKLRDGDAQEVLASVADFRFSDGQRDSA